MSISNSSSFLPSRASNAFIGMHKTFSNHQNDIEDNRIGKNKAENTFKVEQGTKNDHQSPLVDNKEVDIISEKMQKTLQDLINSTQRDQLNKRIDPSEIYKVNEDGEVTTQRKLTEEQIKLKDQIIELANRRLNKKIEISKKESSELKAGNNEYWMDFLKNSQELRYSIAQNDKSSEQGKLSRDDKEKQVIDAFTKKVELNKDTALGSIIKDENLPKDTHNPSLEECKTNLPKGSGILKAIEPRFKKLGRDFNRQPRL